MTIGRRRPPFLLKYSFSLFTQGNYVFLLSLFWGLLIQQSPFCVYAYMRFYPFSVNRRHKQRGKSWFSVENIVV